jgi:hypothetical protein
LAIKKRTIIIASAVAAVVIGLSGLNMWSDHQTSQRSLDRAAAQMGLVTKAYGSVGGLTPVANEEPQSRCLEVSEFLSLTREYSCGLTASLLFSAPANANYQAVASSIKQQLETKRLPSQGGPWGEVSMTDVTASLAAEGIWSYRYQNPEDTWRISFRLVKAGRSQELLKPRADALFHHEDDMPKLVEQVNDQARQNSGFLEIDVEYTPYYSCSSFFFPTCLLSAADKPSH